MRKREKAQIHLSEHFGYRKLLRFALPSVVMAVFTQIYGVVDGLFVSNLVGKSAFTAINLIMPVLFILGAVGLMFGAGGSALISKLLGEGKEEQANNCLTLLTLANAVLGIVIGVIGGCCIRPISALLGAEGETLENCILYGRIIMFALPALMTQFAFQSFFIAAEKPKLGLAVTVAAGLTNAALDAMFIAAFRWGIVGAAVATAAGQVVGGLVPVLYFANRRNRSLLRFVKPRFQAKTLLLSCANGSSELLTNISASFVSMLYNFQLLHLVGEDGVAAYGVVMYVGYVFMSILFGYAMGVAPVIGFHYGAQNREELHGLLKRSLIILAVCGILLTAVAEGLATPLSRLFVGYDKALCDMTVRGLRLYSFAFLIMGFNMFGSSFFTALNNGLVSAVISFSRTFLFQCGAVLLLPLVLQLDGVWLASLVAEAPSLIITVGFLLGMRKKYGY